MRHCVSDGIDLVDAADFAWQRFERLNNFQLPKTKKIPDQGALQAKVGERAGQNLPSLVGQLP
jgi:hypothetical protein